MIQRFYIRILRIMELIIVFPIGIVIITIMDKKFPWDWLKNLFVEWCEWFKNAVDFDYHYMKVSNNVENVSDEKDGYEEYKSYLGKY